MNKFYILKDPYLPFPRGTIFAVKTDVTYAEKASQINDPVLRPIMPKWPDSDSTRVPAGHLAEIDGVVAKALMGVPSNDERFHMFKDTKWQEEIHAMDRNSKVIYHRDVDLSTPAQNRGDDSRLYGTIVGKIMKDELCFDLQVDGSNSKIPNVPAYKLRLRNPEVEPSHSNRIKQHDEPREDSNAVKGLKKGDRVVLYTDKEPETGTVCWIGFLSDCDEPQIGVDFDKPVEEGRGNGIINGKIMFEAKDGHGCFVPASGLVKAEPDLPHARTGRKSRYIGEEIKSGNMRQVALPKESARRKNEGEKSWKVTDPLLTEYEKERIKKRGIGVGTLVEIQRPQKQYGVVRWIGRMNPATGCRKNIRAGIELEELCDNPSNGMFHGEIYFDCEPGRGIFCPIEDIKKDRRMIMNCGEVQRQSYYDSEPVEGMVCPNTDTSRDRMTELCKKMRGIQGLHNSCYMDSTLFAMFMFTEAFDSVLHRPKTEEDIPEYSLVQKILREEIVNPLRKNLYVGSSSVMHLRKTLGSLMKDATLVDQEKDPEEFLNHLLPKIFKMEPFVKLSSKMTSHFYTIFAERDDHTKMPSVQQLFETSFGFSNLQLTEIPPCLLLQMPRCGRDFKLYTRIYPSLSLNISNVLQNWPRKCNMCEEMADVVCKVCVKNKKKGLGTANYCNKCFLEDHKEGLMMTHKADKLSVPGGFQTELETGKCGNGFAPVFKDVTLDLFAVVCIETSHYVSFVKVGKGESAPWVFFDSMADRRGTDPTGYHNVPEIRPYKAGTFIFSPEGHKYLQNIESETELEPLTRRLLCDSYICMYQSPDLVMYK